MAHNRDGSISTPIITHKLSKLKIAADHVLMQISSPESESNGGIIIPADSRQTSTLATVIAHGKMTPETLEDTGLGSPVVGTQVVVASYQVEDPDFEHEGVYYRLVNWNDLTSVWLP